MSMNRGSCRGAKMNVLTELELEFQENITSLKSWCHFQGQTE